MLQKIIIKKLFGYSDIKLEFNDNIKMLYGINGSGKTTVLKIIENIFLMQFKNLMIIDFKEIEVYLKDGSYLKFIRNKDNENHDKYMRMPFETLDISLSKKGQKKYFTLIDSRKTISNKYYTFNEVSRYLKKMKSFKDEKFYSEYLFNMEAISAYTNHSDKLYNTSKDKYIENGELEHIIPKKYYEEQNKILDFKVLYDTLKRGNLKFIGAQRLLIKRNEKEYTSALLEYNNELKNELFTQELIVKNTSQHKENTFLYRLFEENNGVTIGALIDLEEKWNNLKARLRKVGLYVNDKDLKIKKSILELDETEKKVMFLYLKDNVLKYNQFEPLEKKLNIYKKILKEKFGNNKKINFSIKDGIIIKNKLDHEIPLESLSSGEQHELILFYDLIFREKGNSIILLDEPELSLHIDWQRRFIRDIQEITSLYNYQFIIATHSPAIIGEHYELCSEVGASL